jgi:hypothetical protein
MICPYLINIKLNETRARNEERNRFCFLFVAEREQGEVLICMEAHSLFPVEPVYHQLHAKFRVLSGEFVKEIETDEQQELRREVLGVTNAEVEEVKAQPPPPPGCTPSLLQQ